MDSNVVSGPTEDEEARRLAVLRDHHVLDQPVDAELDRLVSLASKVCRAPMAYIGLLDEARVHVAAAVGLERLDLPREGNPCEQVRLLGQRYVVMADLQAEPECVGFPLAKGPRAMRFYAGAGIRTAQGDLLGVLCVGDVQVRHDFGDEDGERLACLAGLIAERFTLRGLCGQAALGAHAVLSLADRAPLGVLCTDHEGRIRYANPAAEQMLQRPIVALQDRLVAELLGNDDHSCNWQCLQAQAAMGEEPTCRFIVLRQEGGTSRHLELRVVPLEVSGLGGYVLILYDVETYRQQQDALFIWADYDPVTELPRADRLSKLWRSYLQQGRLLTLWLVEVEGLQSVNEQAGHRIGNAVFRAMAQRTQLSFEDAEVVRLAGARLAVLCPQPLMLDEIVARSRQALTSLRAPVTIDEQVFRVQARLGVVQANERHGTMDLDSCLSNADLALYEARKHRSGYRLFTPGLQEAVLRRKKLDRELRQAAALEQFALVFQPLLELKSRRVIGAEALLRWNHPAKGQLRPAAFIDTLEASTVAGQVGEWVLTQACHHAAQWRRAGLADFRISVNLFSSQVHGDNLLASVDAALASSGLEPEALELELTETIVLELEPRLVRTLHELRRRGVGLAFDDYGTGYASLSLLKRLPLTRLKIDRAFICNLPQDPGDAAVVEAILLMARQFQLGVVAEGVETPAQEQFLRQLECPEVQGYMYGVPMSAREFWRSFG